MSFIGPTPEYGLNKIKENIELLGIIADPKTDMGTKMKNIYECEQKHRGPDKTTSESSTSIISAIFELL